MASVVARDTNQTRDDISAILEKTKKWNITPDKVHTGTSKRVYVKGKTNNEPTNPWAYLTSRFKTLKDPTIIEKEHKYTRYLSSLFDDLIVPEYPINKDNKELTNVLQAGRDFLITKKDIARSIDRKNLTREDRVELLKFMMMSTDRLIDNQTVLSRNGKVSLGYDGFANLDLKPPNIGITDRFRINDNGSNMFYPIPEKYKEHYRDAIKLVGLFNLIPYGLDKTIFDENYELYDTINYKRALELKKELNEAAQVEIIKYAENRMSKVMVDEKEENLSSLFGDILFPGQLVEWYGTYGGTDFIQNLRVMGLITEEEKEQNKLRQAEQAELERQAELHRQAEIERQAELHRQAEIERQAELHRQRTTKRKSVNRRTSNRNRSGNHPNNHSNTKRHKGVRSKRNKSNRKSNRKSN